MLFHHNFSVLLIFHRYVRCHCCPLCFSLTTKRCTDVPGKTRSKITLTGGKLLLKCPLTYKTPFGVCAVAIGWPYGITTNGSKAKSLCALHFVWAAPALQEARKQAHNHAIVVDTYTWIVCRVGSHQRNGLFHICSRPFNAPRALGFHSKFPVVPSAPPPSQRQAYSLRDAMNTLASDKPEASAVAKTFYRDIEDLTVFARQKNGPACTKAYNDAQEHLTKYLSLI